MLGLGAGELLEEIFLVTHVLCEVPDIDDAVREFLYMGYHGSCFDSESFVGEILDIFLFFEFLLDIQVDKFGIQEPSLLGFFVINGLFPQCEVGLIKFVEQVIIRFILCFLGQILWVDPYDGDVVAFSEIFLHGKEFSQVYNKISAGYLSIDSSIFENIDCTWLILEMVAYILLIILGECKWIKNV